MFNAGMFSSQKIASVGVSLSWGAVGTPLSITGLASTGSCIATLTSTRIVVADSGNGTLTTYDWSGSSFSQVGNQTINLTGIRGICSLSNTSIVMVLADVLQKYDFDGTDWTTDGNTLTGLANANTRMTSLTSTRIAYINSSDDDLIIYDFDGTDWASVGNPFYPTATNQHSITALDSTSVALADGGADTIQKVTFDGMNWSTVGNALSVTMNNNHHTVAALSSSKIAFFDADEDDLRSYSFDGTDWSEVDTELNVATGTGISMTALDSTTVVVLRGTEDEIQTYQLS